MSSGPEFQVEVYQNEYLPDGAREVNAVLTVTASGTGRPQGETRAAEVIIVDCSGSMEYPRDKMAAAIQATSAAIDALRDGVAFAVVAGTSLATPVYPSAGLATTDAQTRAQAKAAVRKLKPVGGTAIGKWLSLASQLFAGHEGALKHVILLTDGRNEHERPEELERVLKACEGRFVCDCRGVGTAWEVAELRKVATALLGTVDIIADPAGLEADFRAMAAAAMGKAVADVSLRLWTPESAKVKFVKQVAPEVVDLTGKRTDSGPRSGDYPTGSWGTESRDYHVCVEVVPGKIGDVMLAARVSLVAGEVLGQALVKAIWTEDPALSTRLSKEIAHYTGQAELAGVIQEGMAAQRAGDVERATAKLGRAVKLAAESGNTETAALLAKVVDVEDPVTGTVRLKSRITEADAMTLDTRSTKTSRVRKS
jgi:hypothetical protein